MAPIRDSKGEMWQERKRSRGYTLALFTSKDLENFRGRRDGAIKFGMWNKDNQLHLYAE